MAEAATKNNSKPIPHRFYRDPETGRTFGLATSWRPNTAELVTEGWSVEHIDGTTGTGRKPFDTEAEAQAWCDARPDFQGMGRMYD